MIFYLFLLQFLSFHNDDLIFLDDKIKASTWGDDWQRAFAIMFRWIVFPGGKFEKFLKIKVNFLEQISVADDGKWNQKILLNH